MESKDTEKIVVAEQEASKPCSDIEPLPTFGKDDDASLSTPSERTLPIRPKIHRGRPLVGRGRSPIEITDSLDDASDSETSFSSEQTESTSHIIYKPVAKPVSRTAALLLANMGNWESSHQETHDKYFSQTPYVSTSPQNLTQQFNIEPTMEQPRSFSQNLESNLSIQQPTSSGDRLSYDGYNWRKYGQKQVKGSEYPRSYYKCTHPNCLVKKKVESSLDGKIVEIVYTGDHNHPKPQPPKRLVLGQNVQGKGTHWEGSDIEINNLLWNNTLVEKNERLDRGIESTEEADLTVPYTDSGYLSCAYARYTGNLSASFGLSEETWLSRGKETTEDQEGPQFKRREIEGASHQVGTSSKMPEAPEQPQIVVQTCTDSDISGDGYRWRKYGQKVVKGNIYSRSYYRCTSLSCSARKHVERLLDDQRSVITTFDGKHNHEKPGENPSSAISQTQSLDPK